MKKASYPIRTVDFENPVTIKYLTRWQNDAYWFKDCCYTIDEARANLSKNDPTIEHIRRFPIEEKCYRILLGLAKTEDVMWILKARRMLITWLWSAYLLKHACFNSGTSNFVIQQSLGATDNILKRRCMFIYDHIPEKHWDDEFKCYVNLKELHPYVEHVRYLIRVPEMNSFIQGVASGEHKIRGETGSVIFWDEIAFNGNILSTWESLYYVKRGGGQIIGATTWYDNDWITLWNGTSGSLNKMIL